MSMYRSNYSPEDTGAKPQGHVWCWVDEDGVFWWDNGELCAVQDHPDHD